MAYLILLKGGVRKWQILGHNEGPPVVNGIPVPPTAVFSARIAAVFTTHEEADRALATTYAYRRAQISAGSTDFMEINGITEIIISVP